MSKQFKKYLILHVDNSKQKNMADMWFPGLGKSETHCSCLYCAPLLQKKESGQNPAHYAPVITVT
jgi:hypothetical protein